MKNIFLTVVLAFLGATTYAYAEDTQNVASAFQKVIDVSGLSIKVPTVIEVPFSESFSNRFDFAVVDETTNTFQPYFFKEVLRSARTSVTVVEGGEMLDGDMSTFKEFMLPQNAQGRVELHLVGAKPLMLSGVTFFLDRYVALPTSIEVHALVNGVDKIVLARSQMQSNMISFPKTVAKDWVVSLTYGQLLRINEIVLKDESAGLESSQALRFLAQPGHAYHIYFDADRSVSMRVGESGNLTGDKGVLMLPRMTAAMNTNYKLADTDGDAVPDIRDNCVSTPNSDQMDVDGNGRGDVCDDFDRDGLMNKIDNCPNDPNYNQADADGDKIGDVCDHEESRTTEKYPWLPWAGIGFAGMVLVVLFAITARSMFKK